MTEANIPPVMKQHHGAFGMQVMRGGLRLLARTAPSLASRVAANIFLTPRRFRTPEREVVALADAAPLTIRFGDEDLHAWSWGAGPLVILVHGWEGRGSQLAPFVRPLVERGFRVVTFDAPGHGRSRAKQSSLPHFAWALRSVADAIAPVHAIVAHSFGCAAVTLAMHEGLAASRVVFIAPPFDPSSYTERFGEVLGLEPNVVAAMKQRLEQRFLRKWSDYSLGTLARNLRAPLLVVHDRDDHETFLWEGEAVAAAWSGAQLIVTEGLGHRRILRDPRVLADVAGFVSRSC